MSKDRRLGRGLAALLGTPGEGEPGGPRTMDAAGTAPGNRGGANVAGPLAPPEPAVPPDARKTTVAGPRLATETVAADGSQAAASVEAPAEPAPREVATDEAPRGTSPEAAREEVRARPRPASASASKPSEPPADQDMASSGDESSTLLELNVFEIEDNPFQPRRDFSEAEIASLAESLKEHDMLQPVLVRRIGNRYQLISGERRLRAAIQAGWTTVPARVREADDRLVAELAIVENLQRQDLNAVEKALSFRRYLDQHECTQEDLASRLKIDRSTIANLLRLLELPETVLNALRESSISAGHARALLPLGEEPEQVAYCERIVKEGWSVRETERQVQDKILAEDGEGLAVVGGKGRKKKKSAPNQQVVLLEQELRMALGTKVEIRQTGRGRGRITIHFTSHREFERIRDLLVGEDYLDDQAEVG